MSDRERLLAWFESGALVRPDAAVPNSVDLARVLARLCGVPLDATSDGERQIEAAVGRAEHLVFILVDGLGMNLIESLPDHSPLRRALAMELRAVFPSTTAAALTSLATGAWPAQHAVLSWWLYLPEADITATILPFVERWSRRPLAELGVDAACAFPVPPLVARYRRTVHTHMPRGITGTTYSNYSAAKAATTPWNTLDDVASAISDRITAARSATYTYVYIPNVDAAEHNVGPDGTETAVALARVERIIAALASALAGRARIVVTADHGVLETPAASRHVIASFDELPELRFPRTGEPRVPFFHVRDGECERFASRFRERFGAHFALISVDDADALRLFGPAPLSGAARARLGDFIALADGPDVISYAVEEKLRGHHAGLSPAEMRVPLIVI